MVARTKYRKEYLYKANGDVISVLLQLVEDINRHNTPRLKKHLCEFPESKGHEKLKRPVEM